MVEQAEQILNEDFMASDTEPHLVLTIPHTMCKDFLGIFALDVLHDAKGRGYLAGNRLSQVTDLLANSIMMHNRHLGLSEQDRAAIELYTFQQVLAYFLELWSDNISALGLDFLPNFANHDPQYWQTMRTIVRLPFRLVAEREDEDAFVSLGKNKHGAEAQNYFDQKNQLSSQHAEGVTFVSPKGINRPSDYFHQAAGIVDIIRHRTKDSAKVVLDMKSAAGLIRTLTDPLGYTTGLPTYADPGYNMPGMSAIRQHAEVAFMTQPEPGTFSGVQSFEYCVKLQTPLKDVPLTVLDVTYFYGIAKDGLDRTNMVINILDESFRGTLPRSMMMADALNYYLQPQAQAVTVTLGQILGSCQSLISTYYDSLCHPIPYITSLNTVLNELHGGVQPTVNTFSGILVGTVFSGYAEDITEWATEENTILRTAYIVATLRNMSYFNIQTALGRLPLMVLEDELETAALKGEDLLPAGMIETVLPDLMYLYMTEGQNPQLLAFCYHQYKLLEQYIGQPYRNNPEFPYQTELGVQLSKKWLPSRKGKLVTQISKQTQLWRKAQAAKLIESGDYLRSYVQQLLQHCQLYLGELLHLEDVDADDPGVLPFLQNLPTFEPPAEVLQMLSSHLHFYEPELFLKTGGMNRTGLLLASFLDTLLWKKPLLSLNLDMNLSLHVRVAADLRTEEYAYDALHAMLGKFSGDFGQILWCICYGHLFASEDNNTSAMATMLHRLPKECIHRRNTNGNVVWGNIHGLGDGSCVDVLLDK